MMQLIGNANIIVQVQWKKIIKNPHLTSLQYLWTYEMYLSGVFDCKQQIELWRTYQFVEKSLLTPKLYWLCT